jgi:hypothetical protein
MAAAQAEAVRPGGDPRTARDYNLAGRAAAAIEAAGDRSLPVPVNPVKAAAFVAAFEALQREQVVNRHSTAAPPDDAKAIHAAANHARSDMAGWVRENETGGTAAGGGRSSTTGPTTAQSTSGIARVAKADAVALKAGVDAAEKRWSAAETADQQLARQASQHTDPSIAATAVRAVQHAQRATDAARQIDAVIADQEKLIQSISTTSADRGGAGSRLAASLRELATRIDTLSRRYAPIGAGGVPGTPTDTNLRERAAAAPAITRSRLAAFSRLSPALIAARFNQAIAFEETTMAAAHEELVALDPLTAAKWMARSAADGLETDDLDRAGASHTFVTISTTLSTARDRCLRYATLQRLAAVRSMRAGAASASVLVDAPAVGSSNSGGTTLEPRRVLSGLASQWRRVRPREQDDPATPPQDVDIPGYTPAIKAYFEALGKK